ncbi:MAG: hypothetical protein QF415_03960 [Candidatus Undinarchaeales archaeon]|nr:hypothetical protein [Candidatus Undinarchaeales archaeon]MDP7493254.1 hypothetical protein [Candidatus Undinarchaeales archaeon]
MASPNRDHLVWLALVLSAYPLISPLPSNLVRFAIGTALLIWLMRDAARFVGIDTRPEGISPLHILALLWLALYWMAFSALNTLFKGRMGAREWSVLLLLLGMFVMLMREADRVYRARL